VELFRRKNKTVDAELLNNGFRYALSLTGSRADAEDLVHDAWIRLTNRYRSGLQKGLLYVTIRNLYIDSYRRKQRVVFTEFKDDEVSGSHVNERVTTDEMNYFLNQLRDIEREVIYLSVVEGYTADEIANMIDKSRGTVLSLIHRSKIKLRTLMAEANIDGEQSEVPTVIDLIGGGTYE